MTIALRSLIIMGLAGGAAAADQAAAVDHEVRQQESAQKALAGQAAAAAKELDDLAAEYAANQVGDPKQAQTLGQIARSLQHVAEPGAAGDEKTMSWVQARLAAARAGTDRDAELTKAAAGQGQILGQIDGMLRDARSIGGKARGRGIDEVEAEQKRLLSSTGKLGDATLGKSEQELSVDEKVEKNRIDQQQRQLKEALRRALDQLAEDARQEAQLDPDRAQTDEQTAKDIAALGIDQDMQRAADAVKGGRLEEAQEAQQAALDKLEKAQQAAGPPVEVPIETMSDFDREYQQLLEFEHRQEEIKAVADKLAAASSAAEYDQLEAQEKQLANDMRAVKDARAAAKEADGAAKDLDAHDRPKSSDDMQKVLDALAQAKADLIKRGGQISWCPADPGGSPDGTVPANTPIQEQDLKKNTANGAWRIDLPPEARQTISQSANEKFPPQYEQDLVRYYRDLAAVATKGDR
jgi:hypothetical protein